MKVIIDDKGGITIPHEILEAAGIQPGSKVEVSLKDDGSVIIRPITKEDKKSV